MKYNWILTVLGIVVGALLLQQLVRATLDKEGFRTQEDVESEDRLSPEVFSYNLLQAIKGPIRRLSGQLLDLNAWRERWDLAQLSPVELARRNLRAQ